MMACSGVSVTTAENPSIAAPEAALQAAELALQRHLKLSEEEPVEEVQQRMSSLQEKVDNVQRSAAQAIQLQEQRDALIQQANAKQIQHLIGQLKRVSEQEQARRLAKKEDQSSSTPAQEEDSSKLPSDWQSQLDPARVLAESEEELEAWILSLMRDELENADPLLSSPSSSSSAQHHVVDDDSDECWTTTTAVTEVQAALNRWTLDGIGRPDLLQPPQSGGEAAVAATMRIVHELTSPTYQPPPSRQSAASLSWWHRYLPQDWEVALEWLLPTEHGVDHLLSSSLSSIPDHVYHTLGLQTSQAVTAPPETILQDSLLPGACWPVAMPNEDSNDGGAVPPTVTIRLPVPAATISAVTLDHVSQLLVSDRSSAPKRARVYGYAPCASSSSGCDDGLGFRLSSKRWLADVTYNLDGDSIQTFDVAPAAAAETAGMVEDGSCSAVEEPATCGGGGEDDGGCVRGRRVAGDSGKLGPSGLHLFVPISRARGASRRIVDYVVERYTVAVAEQQWSNFASYCILFETNNK